MLCQACQRKINTRGRKSTTHSPMKFCSMACYAKSRGRSHFGLEARVNVRRAWNRDRPVDLSWKELPEDLQECLEKYQVAKQICFGKGITSI